MRIYLLAFRNIKWFNIDNTRSLTFILSNLLCNLIQLFEDINKFPRGFRFYLAAAKKFRANFLRKSMRS